MRLPKRVIFALAAIGLSFVVCLGGMLALDLYLHARYEPLAALNVRGYRGSLLKRKKPNEYRIAVLGGSTVFGYGVHSNETFPAYLEEDLNHHGMPPPVKQATVLNLGANSEGAYSFLPNLQDFAYLGYDGAIFYEGYNDITNADTPNRFLARRGEPAFYLFGYMPIFPLILREKAMVLRYGGDLDSAYWGRKTVFHPNLAQRASASTLEAAVAVSQSLEQQLGRLTYRPEQLEPVGEEIGCGARWAYYCQSVDQAIQYLLDRGKWVIVVTQPYNSDLHVDQQRHLVGMLHQRYGQNHRVMHVNLGNAIDLHDLSIAYDGKHLMPAGNRLIAEKLEPAVLQMVGKKSSS